jgi:hypothetical protein
MIPIGKNEADAISKGRLLLTEQKTIEVNQAEYVMSHIVASVITVRKSIGPALRQIVVCPHRSSGQCESAPNKLSATTTKAGQGRIKKPPPLALIYLCQQSERSPQSGPFSQSILSRSYEPYPKITKGIMYAIDFFATINTHR